MKITSALILGSLITLSTSAHAAIINVAGKCSIFRAIASANNDASPRGYCVAGSGPDTINLPSKRVFVLTRVNNVGTYGAVGLPIIRSAITINGNGSNIHRSAKAPAFGLFVVLPIGQLHLNRLAVSGGKEGGRVPHYHAGALLNFGITTMNNVVVSGNTGAVSNRHIMIIDHSKLIKNGNRRDSGTLGSFGRGDASLTVKNSSISINDSDVSPLYLEGTANISNTIIAHNFADLGTGGIFLNGATATIIDSTIVGNFSGSTGGGVYAQAGANLSLIRNVISGNEDANGDAFDQIQIYDSTVVSDQNNLIGQNGEGSVIGFVKSPSDIVPNVPVEQIVDPVTGQPAPHSPVIDGVTDGTCPPNSGAVDGNGDGGVACDIGAIEAPAPTTIAPPAPSTPPTEDNQPSQPAPETTVPPVKAPVVQAPIDQGITAITNIPAE